MEEKKALQPEELAEVIGGLRPRVQCAVVAKALTGSVATVAVAEINGGDQIFPKNTSGWFGTADPGKGMSQAPDLPATTLEK